MKTPATGNNRTGLATASAEDQDGVQTMAMSQPATGPATASVGGDGFALVREAMAIDTEGVGSIPPPATVAGKIKSAIGTLSGESMAVFMDRLGQRLAFERQGSRLYEGLIAKFRAAESADLIGSHGPTLEDLIELHDEELQHFLLLQQTMADLGGDPTAQTPAADVAAVANMGLPQVVNDPRTSFLQSLEAMLVAELVDNDGWEMLEKLARGLGYQDLAARFLAAKQDEEDHLRRVRTWLSLSTMDEAGAA
jgi:hypothetical protein